MFFVLNSGLRSQWCWKLMSLLAHIISGNDIFSSFFSEQSVRPAHRPSAAVLWETFQPHVRSRIWQEAWEQKLWRRHTAGLSGVQTGRMCAPQGSALRSHYFQPEENTYIWIMLQGDVVSVTFVAGNPRHSGDIVRKKQKKTTFVLGLSFG